MAFKFVIGDKGKAWRVESDNEAITGKSIGDKIDGKDIKTELEGYQFEVKGGSDQAGFPMYKEAEGIGLKRVLFSKGWGMHDKKDGLRLRKTVRGKTISTAVTQINMTVVKAGAKPLAEIFADQNQPKVKKAVPAAKPAG